MTCEICFGRLERAESERRKRGRPVVGMFGIGRFANLGVCESLTVISQSEDDESGHWTRLSPDIQEAGGAIPQGERWRDQGGRAPRYDRSRRPRCPADLDSLRAYVQEFVRFADEPVYFNGELLSGQPFQVSRERGAESVRIESDETDWTLGHTTVVGTLNEGPGHVLQAELIDLVADGEPVRLRGWLRFENGSIEVMKRGSRFARPRLRRRSGSRVS